MSEVPYLQLAPLLQGAGGRSARHWRHAKRRPWNQSRPPIKTRIAVPTQIRINRFRISMTHPGQRARLLIVQTGQTCPHEVKDDRIDGAISMGALAPLVGFVMWVQVASRRISRRMGPRYRGRDVLRTDSPWVSNLLRVWPAGL